MTEWSPLHLWGRKAGGFAPLQRGIWGILPRCSSHPGRDGNPGADFLPGHSPRGNCYFHQGPLMPLLPSHASPRKSNPDRSPGKYLEVLNQNLGRGRGMRRGSRAGVEDFVILVTSPWFQPSSERGWGRGGVLGAVLVLGRCWVGTRRHHGPCGGWEWGREPGLLFPNPSRLHNRDWTPPEPL